MQAWTPNFYLKSFVMDSVQVGKAVFGKEIYTTLGIKQWTFLKILGISLPEKKYTVLGFRCVRYFEFGACVGGGCPWAGLPSLQRRKPAASSDQTWAIAPPCQAFPATLFTSKFASPDLYSCSVIGFFAFTRFNGLLAVCLLGASRVL